MKTYVGDRTIDGIQVTVNGRNLDTREDIRCLSKEGFEWSYEGDEPAQLAVAILADHLDDPARSLRLYERFMREVVANFDNTWEMTSADIDQILEAWGERAHAVQASLMPNPVQGGS